MYQRTVEVMNSEQVHQWALAQEFDGCCIATIIAPQRTLGVYDQMRLVDSNICEIAITSKLEIFRNK